jgi:precorrin-2/cobalt-factor-2 C20-methyltransferase
MTGRLYVIGIGPGDPELLTLKAVRILERVPTICVPKGREEGTSLALSIVRQTVNLDGTEIIEAHFPMKKTRKPDAGEKSAGTETARLLEQKWESTAQEIITRLKQGTDVAFITLGDPAIYSTYFYLHDVLRKRMPDIVIEFVPGISSVTAAASRAGISLGLGDEQIAILPATYAGDIRTVLAEFDTVVLMKVHSVLKNVLPVLKELQLAGNAVYIARVGMPDERIVFDVGTLTPDDLDYFSLLIVRTGKRNA